MQQISDLRDFDYLLVDTAPGMDSNVCFLNAAVDNVQIIVTPEPSSIADAYTLIKVLNTRYKVNKFNVICNQVKDEFEGVHLFKRLNEVAANFLYISLQYIGSIPSDPHLRRATRDQKLVARSKPYTVANQSLSKVSKKVTELEGLREAGGGMKFFWDHLVGVA